MASTLIAVHRRKRPATSSMRAISGHLNSVHDRLNRWQLQPIHVQCAERGPLAFFRFELTLDLGVVLVVLARARRFFGELCALFIARTPGDRFFPRSTNSRCSRRCYRSYAYPRGLSAIRAWPDDPRLTSNEWRRALGHPAACACFVSTRAASAVLWLLLSYRCAENR